jgi:hypothetical protein
MNSVVAVDYWPVVDSVTGRVDLRIDFERWIVDEGAIAGYLRACAIASWNNSLSG